MFAHKLGKAIATPQTLFLVSETRRMRYMKIISTSCQTPNKKIPTSPLKSPNKHKLEAMRSFLHLLPSQIVRERERASVCVCGARAREREIAYAGRL